MAADNNPFMDSPKTMDQVAAGANMTLQDNNNNNEFLESVNPVGDEDMKVDPMPQFKPPQE